MGLISTGLYATGDFAHGSEEAIAPIGNGDCIDVYFSKDDQNGFLECGILDSDGNPKGTEKELNIGMGEPGQKQKKCLSISVSSVPDKKGGFYCVATAIAASRYVVYVSQGIQYTYNTNLHAEVIYVDSNENITVGRQKTLLLTIGTPTKPILLSSACVVSNKLGSSSGTFSILTDSGTGNFPSFLAGYTYSTDKKFLENYKINVASTTEYDLDYLEGKLKCPLYKPSSSTYFSMCPIGDAEGDLLIICSDGSNLYYAVTDPTGYNYYIEKKLKLSGDSPSVCYDPSECTANKKATFWLVYHTHSSKDYLHQARLTLDLSNFSMTTDLFKKWYAKGTKPAVAPTKRKGDRIVVEVHQPPGNYFFKSLDLPGDS